jgi:sec-independent protein translocase protein TatB
VSAVHGQVSLLFMGIPPTIEIANLGMADTLILMVMALVVFGPRRLPQIGRQIGKLMYEFRKASNDFKFQMEEELRNAEEADRRQKEEAERQRQLAANPPAQIEASVTAAETTAAETPAESDSGYPYSSTYGELTEAQEKTETSSPSIQPPATGEPVPAEWTANETSAAEPAVAEAPAVVESADAVAETPASVITETPAVAEAAPVEKENAVTEATVEDTNKTQETAAHNA